MDNQVDFWFGFAKNKATYRSFLKEQYKDGSKPLSEFAASQGERFYDHDFIESEFTGKGLTPEEALHSISYGSSFVSQIIEKSEGVQFNFFIASYSDSFNNPQSAQLEGIDLQYVGRFTYDLKAGSAVSSAPLETVYLHLLNGKKLLFESELTDSFKVDASGLTIGGAASAAGVLDVSSLVPDVAQEQLRISRNSEGMWVLQDLGNNGLSRLGKESFDNEKAMPWPGILFSIGDLVFLWSGTPK